MARSCPECGVEYADDVAVCEADGKVLLQVQEPGAFDRRIGSTLGNYIVSARVADGAMGRVYEARHPETKERVAIKVLHPDVARDRVAVERFKREFEAAAELEHPGVVAVKELGATDDNSWYLVMEYLSGEELSKTFARDNQLSEADFVSVFTQLCVALDHAHSFGFVHRDLKPDNVFLCKTADRVHVKVLDFGSVKLQMETGAKLTAFGTTLGSPYYMSPEQAMGKQDVDQRTDIFAVAAIAWEAITGKVAFDGANVAQILLRIVNDMPAPPSSLNSAYPSRIDDAILRALSKEKSQRPATAGGLADALVSSIGLEGAASSWASKSREEIATALAARKPTAREPAPEPARAPTSGPIVEATTPATAAPKGSSTGLWLGIGAVVLGAVLFLLFR